MSPKIMIGPPPTPPGSTWGAEEGLCPGCVPAFGGGLDLLLLFSADFVWSPGAPPPTPPWPTRRPCNTGVGEEGLCPGGAPAFGGGAVFVKLSSESSVVPSPTPPMEEVGLCPGDALAFGDGGGGGGLSIVGLGSAKELPPTSP